LSRLDFILLSFFESVVIIGYYAIGYRLFEIASIGMSAIQAAFFPRLSRTLGRDKSRFIIELRLFLPALIILISLVSLVGYGVAETYVRVLFTNQFPHPVLISQLFMLLLVLHAIDQTFSQALNAIDQQNRDTQAIALGVPVYAALLFFLIPIFGMLGAFAATSITLLFQSVIRFKLLRRSTGRMVFSNWELLAMALAFIGAPTVLLNAGDVIWWQQFLLGLLAFLVSVLILTFFGLVRLPRANSLLYAREGRSQNDVASIGALVRFLAYDYLRFNGWWRRKQRNCNSVRNFGFVAVFLLRVSRYFLLVGWPRLSRFIWQLNTIVSKSDIRPTIRIGPGFVLDGNAIGITGDVGHSVSVFAHTALGRHGSLDIGAGPGLPVVGNNVVLSPRAYVLGPLKIDSGVRVGAHAKIFRVRQIRNAASE